MQTTKKKFERLLSDKETVNQDTMLDKNGKQIPVVHMEMILDKSIDHKLYRYIVHGDNEVKSF